MYVDFAACDAYSNGLAACARVSCPVLLVLGTRDAMTPPRAAKGLSAALSDVRVVEIEGAGHAIMAEQPDVLLAALERFGA
jgi:pimeloyl-ACP methyl ester carboxylesterase